MLDTKSPQPYPEARADLLDSQSLLGMWNGGSKDDDESLTQIRLPINTSDELI